MNETTPIAQYLATLKVGDPIYVASRGVATQRLTVTKITSTQVVVDNERYRKSDGWRVGRNDPFYIHKILLPTPDVVERVARINLRSELQRIVDLKEITIPQMTAMIEAFKLEGGA